MTPDEDYMDEPTDSKNREAAAAAALAAGVGVSAGAGGAVAQETQDVVLKASHYYPNEEFVILTDFEERNRVEFLEEYDDDEDVFDDHDDWEVYSALVEAGEPAGRLVLMMIENGVDPDPGDRGTMGDSPSFWDYEWDMLEVDVTFDDDDNDVDDEDDEDDDDDDNDVDDEDDEDDDDDDNDVDDEDDEDDDDGILG